MKHQTDRIFIVLVLTIVVWATGCPSTEQNDQTVAVSADQVLKDMIAAYRGTGSYTDRGRIRLSWSDQGKRFDDQAPLAVTFARPNKLRVTAYHLDLTADGEILQAKLLGQTIPELAAQLVQRPMPRPFTLSSLSSDEVLWDQLARGAGGEPIQASLLLDQDPLADVFDPSVQRKLLEKKTHDGRLCHRVQVSTDSGQLVFWIDAVSHELRQLQYPEEQGVSLVADFRDARLGGAVDHQAFQLDPPGHANVVRFFVLPPQPLPSDLFGQRVGRFSLTDLSGGEVSRSSLAGKVAVLVWFNDHPNCRENLRQIEPIYQQFRGDARVEFRAVWAEGGNISDDQLRRLLSQWEVGIPVARDNAAHGNELLKIPAAPTLIVLGSDGTLQIFEVGVNPDVSRQLPTILGRLFDGHDLAGEVLRYQRREEVAYQKRIASASGKGVTTLVEMPTINVGQRTEPRWMRLAELWTQTALESPGNIEILDDTDGQPRILVVDNRRTIVEVGRSGQLDSSHHLAMPEDAAIDYLHAAADGSGRHWFAGMSNMARQVFVYDDEWTLSLTYPDINQPHDGIRAVQLADTNGDGSPELFVGYWGIVGLQAVEMDGARLWTNRNASSILSLALTPPVEVPDLLVTSSSGLVLRINARGRKEREVQVGTYSVYHLATSDDVDAVARYCALAYTPDGNHVAVALDRSLEEVWSYRLPPMGHRNPIRPLRWARFLDPDTGCWLLAGADGSIHVVSDDGSFFDHFQYGQSIHGIHATRFGQRDVLLVATESELTAWSVERQNTLETEN